MSQKSTEEIATELLARWDDPHPRLIAKWPTELSSLKKAIKAALDAERQASAERIAELERQLATLKSAVDTIPAGAMLMGGPPYKLTFTEDCLKEIWESQQ